MNRTSVLLWPPCLNKRCLKRTVCAETVINYGNYISIVTLNHLHITPNVQLIFPTAALMRPNNTNNFFTTTKLEWITIKKHTGTKRLPILIQSQLLLLMWQSRVLQYYRLEVASSRLSLQLIYNITFLSFNFPLKLFVLLVCTERSATTSVQMPWLFHNMHQSVSPHKQLHSPWCVPKSPWRAGSYSTQAVWINLTTQSTCTCCRVLSQSMHTDQHSAIGIAIVLLNMFLYLQGICSVSTGPNKWL